MIDARSFVPQVQSHAGGQVPIGGCFMTNPGQVVTVTYLPDPARMPTTVPLSSALFLSNWM
jgi:hypothetical protein